VSASSLLKGVIVPCLAFLLTGVAFEIPAGAQPQLKEVVRFGRADAAYQRRVFSPDSRHSVSTYGNEIAFFRLADGGLHRSLAIKDARSLDVLGVSRDNQIVAVNILSSGSAGMRAKERALAVWTISPVRELFRLPAAPPWEGMQLSQDGKWLAGINGDELVEILDATSGRMVHRVPRLLVGKVHSLHFGEDDNTLVMAAGPYEVRLDLKDFEKLTRREWTLRPNLRSLARNGRQLCIDATSFAVVDGYSNRTLWEVALDEDRFTRPLVSPDGRIVTALRWRERVLEVRDATDGKLLGEIKTASRTPIITSDDDCFTPDSRYLCAGQYVWDLARYRLLSHTLVPRAAERVLFSPGNQLLCVQDDAEFWTFDIALKKLVLGPVPGHVFACEGQPAEAFTFIPIGSSSVKKDASPSGLMQRIDARRGNVVWTWRTPPQFAHQGSYLPSDAPRITAAVMTNDKRRVLFANDFDYGVLDLATGKSERADREQGENISLRNGPVCVVQAGSRAIYLAEAHPRIALIDHRSGQPVWQVDLADPTALDTGRETTLSIGPKPVCGIDGKLYLLTELIAKEADGVAEAVGHEIVVLNAQTGRVLSRYPCSFSPSQRWAVDGFPMAASRDGRWLAVAGPRSLRLLDCYTGKTLTEITLERAPICHVTFSYDNNYIAAGSHAGQLFVWKVER
jgi:WD40 repeat protein